MHEPSETSPSASTSDARIEDPATTIAGRRRRRRLILAGVSLLTLGAVLNVERFDFDFASEEETEAPVATLGFASADEDEAGGPATRHKGEEGKMGKPTSKAKSGLYALKGPKQAAPQMAREFDPDMAARNKGILGVMAQDSGHFLASPYGGAYAVGDESEDVWGGLTGHEVGEAYGAGGLGLVGTGRGGGGTGEGTIGLGNTGLIGKGGGGGVGQGYGRGSGYRANRGAERYAPKLPPVAFVDVDQDRKSTFSIDVDTAAYSNARRYLLEDHMLPPVNAVRTEELINYFNYDYRPPTGDAPFSVTTEVGPCPWAKGHRLVHIGVQGKVVEQGELPPRNLVFLLDVSGSMSSPDKLPLVKHGLASLTEQLGPEDRVSIVVYAGAAGVVLPPTSGADKAAILGALDRLQAGGSTNGGQGIELAYAQAEKHFVKGGINRVILATDGDFNVGISNHDALIDLIEEKREGGVFVSVLGFGTGNLNDHTMEQIADKGNGNYAYIDGLLEARKVLVEQAGATLHTIAKDVKIQVEFDPDQVESHRLVGYENRVLAHSDFDDDTKDAGEIGAGHTVTALYEVVPRERADADDSLMTLNMRYKQPEGRRSAKLSAEVHDRGRELDDASTDYRFSAAVAEFGELLRGRGEAERYAEVLELAELSLGADPNCYRHQFLDMVWQAGTLAGQELAKPDSACTPGAREPESQSREPLELDSGPVVEVEVHERGPSEAEVETEAERSFDWAFVLEVLRLLPPLLALPLFIMAIGKPRRRRR